MNTQEIIQALINNKLIENAKMQAYDRNYDNLEMLVSIATSKVLDIIPLMLELNIQQQEEENQYVEWQASQETEREIKYQRNLELQGFGNIY